MGSYRRGALNSGDIDLLITRNPSDGKDHKGAFQLLNSSASAMPSQLTLLALSQE